MTTDELTQADEADTDEESRYEEAFRATRRALDEAIELLMLLEHREPDPDARSDIGEDLLELERDREDLVRANLAFHSGRAVMVPPSQELLDDILANSKEVVDLTAERATASAVLKLATDALAKFAEIQQIGRS
ncbi:MAG TPA: hypothetical protein VMV45_14855 [Casimicrobiaceae bacterium]|nr:hypothetical protein [Casimicrobiaceae bacterium]